MAKKKAKKKSKKAVRKVAKVKDEAQETKSQYGHTLSKQSGFIDVCLEAGNTDEEIRKLWDKAHPGNKMKDGRIHGHLQHLVEKHGFSKNTAQQLLAASKVSKKKS